LTAFINQIKSFVFPTRTKVFYEVVNIKEYKIKRIHWSFDWLAVIILQNAIA